MMRITPRVRANLIRVGLLAIATAFLVVALASALSRSSAGDLDRSFGHHGTVVTRIGDIAGINSVAIDAKGRIVAAGAGKGKRGSNNGAFALARYKPNGAADPSFSGNGQVTTGTH